MLGLVFGVVRGLNAGMWKSKLFEKSVMRAACRFGADRADGKLQLRLRGGGLLGVPKSGAGGRTGEMDSRSEEYGFDLAISEKETGLEEG
jgi:hypothetical protein